MMVRYDLAIVSVVALIISGYVSVVLDEGYVVITLFLLYMIWVAASVDKAEGDKP